MFQDYGHSTTKLKDTPCVSGWYINESGNSDFSYMFCGFGHLCVFDNLDISGFHDNHGYWHKHINALLNCHVRSITLAEEWYVKMTASYACVTNSRDQLDATWYDSEGHVYEDADFGHETRSGAKTYYDTPIETYGYKNTTDTGEKVFGLARDNKRSWYVASYNLPSTVAEESSWEWNSNRDSFTKVKVEESFKNYSGLTSTAWMFSNFNNVKSQEGFEYLNTSNVTDMRSMFKHYGKTLNTVPNVSNWNTTNVKNMSSMFCEYSFDSNDLNQAPDVSKWNTSNAEDMSDMFSEYGRSSTSLNQAPAVSKWNTSNVSNLASMFEKYGFSSNLKSTPDVSNWNTSKVENMDFTFSDYACHSSFECLNLSNWDTRNVKESWYMLDDMKLKSIILGSYFSLDLSHFPHGNLTNSKGEEDATWYDSKGTDMSPWVVGFQNRHNTTIYYDTNPSSVEAYGYRDGNTLVLTYDRDKSIHESQSQTVYSIPTNATEVKSWPWSRDRYDLTKIKINPNFRDYDKLTSTAYMFSYFNNVTENEGFQYLDTSNVTNMSNMFSWYARSLEDTNIMPDVANWDTSKVEDMSGMFYDYAYDSKTLCDTPCVLNWNTSNVKDMSDMFYEYGYSSKKLYSAPDISNWNTSNVETMFSMFYKYTFNSFLPSLDLSNLDTTKVKNCNFMLDGVKVRSIKLGPKFNLDLTSDAGRLNNTLLKMDATWYDNDGKAYPGASIGTQPRTVATDYLEVYPEKSNVALHSNNVINQQHAIDNAISQHSQNSSLIHHITHHVSKVADVVKKVFH